MSFVGNEAPVILLVYIIFLIIYLFQTNKILLMLIIDTVKLLQNLKYVDQ